MKVRLIRPARIRHEAGEIVEVSPAEAGFLFSTGSAEGVPGKKTTETMAAEMPEEKETQEKSIRKTTRKRVEA